VLRRKTAQVMAGSGLPPASHDGKALQHVLDTFPRDELFQISEDELLATAVGILNLASGKGARVSALRPLRPLCLRPRLRAPRALQRRRARKDSRHPRARLQRPFVGGNADVGQRSIGACALYRWTQFRTAPDADVKELEAEIRGAIRTWDDGFADAMQLAHGEATSNLARRYANAFPAGYRDSFSPADAVEDIGRIEAVLKGEAAGGTLAAMSMGATANLTTCCI